MIRVPVEIAKQRRQTISTRTSSISILMEAYRTEGIRRGLYRGYGSTILREVPFAFIQFPLWEHFKANWTVNTGLDLTPIAVAFCGAVAGGIGTTESHKLLLKKSTKLLNEHSPSCCNNNSIRCCKNQNYVG